MATNFPGFPKEMFKFLRELKKNNNREWFNDNKSRYIESIAEPMGEFIIAMQAPLQEISPHYIADPRRQGGSMFRIYRDARFSKDKRPYKENVGCQFRHEVGKDAHAPGFYLHIEPGNIFFGGGIWMPPNPSLNKIRMMIDAFPKSWQQVVEDKALQKRTDGVQGDGLKRPPRGFAPDHIYIEDLKRKTFFAMSEVDESVATSPKMMKEVVTTFRAVSPLVKFLTRSLELPY